MSEAGRRRWWCVGAVAVVGGAIALGSWIGVIHPVTAEPAPQAAIPSNAPAELSEWVRAQAHHQQQCYPPQPQGEVIQTAALVPEIPEPPVNTGYVVPVISPQVPVMPPPPAPIGGPRSYDAGVVGSGTPLPTIPTIPTAGNSLSPTTPISLTPAAPATPNPLPPVTPSVTAPAIPAPPNDLVVAVEIPTAPPSAPAIPTMPSPAPETAAPMPALPVIPPPAPPSPGLPAPLNIPTVPSTPTLLAPPTPLAPTPPSLQFPDSIQPVLPVQPENTLPHANAGISVKPETPAGINSAPGALPALPVPQSLTSPSTSGALVDRPKTGIAETPVSEKDDFQPPISAPRFTELPPRRTEDDTMKKFQKQAAFLAMLGGLFLAPGANHAEEPNAASDKAAKQEKVDLIVLNRQIEELTKKIGQMQEDQKKLLADMKLEQKGILEVLKGRRDDKGFPVESEPGLVAQMKQLNDRLSALEQKLNKPQTALRPAETPSAANAPRAAKGIVRIVNDYPVPISMVINGTTSYKVEPQKVRDIEVPAGRFTYQLLESGAAPTESGIRENETVTLRIK